MFSRSEEINGSSAGETNNMQAPKQDEGKRASWRPRFTTRTLFILLTLACAYLASWEATKRFGVLPNSTQRAPMPFIVTDESRPNFKMGVDDSPLTMECMRTYFVWCWGRHELFSSQVTQTFPELSRREQKDAIRKHILQRKKQQRRNQSTNE